MREVLDRGELHALFTDELRRHRDADGSAFVFEIDEKPADAGGCNWYPLATLELWRGDLTRNLRVFGEVRARLCARYNLAPAEAALTTADAAAVG